jgi:hypothetical protein
MCLSKNVLLSKRKQNKALVEGPGKYTVICRLELLRAQKQMITAWSFACKLPVFQ